MRSFRRRGDGLIAVRLSAREHALLASLPQQIAALLTGESESSAVRVRLFPPAYDEPEHEQEYRQLMDDELLDDRLAALRTFAETLEQGSVKRGVWQTELTPEAADAWLSTTNDARLALGVVAGITTETQWEEPDEENPTHMTLMYLGWLQEQLLSVLMRGIAAGEPPGGE